MYARIEIWTVLDGLHVHVIGWGDDQQIGAGTPAILGGSTGHVSRETVTFSDLLCAGIDEAHELIHSDPTAYPPSTAASRGGI